MRMGTAWLLVALACLLVPAPARGAGLACQGTQLLWQGKPIFLRGSFYVQPAAYHHCFLTELEEAQLGPDFRAMREAGLNCLAICVNWGDLMPRLEAGTRRYDWDRGVTARLRRLLAAAQREGLIVDLWFGTARMPLGVPGCTPGEAETDLAGHRHQPYAGYVWPNYPGCMQLGDYEWQAFLEFHRRVAELTRGFDNVLFDPLDWQHLNMNYWCWANPRNLEAWQAWLRQRNPDLGYWGKRWGEDLSQWEGIFFPVDEWVRRTAALHAGSPYAGKPDTPEGPKCQDFRAWHDGLCNQVAVALTAALKQVRPEVLIGQRVDLWHYGDFRANTWAVGQVDLIFQGWYSEQPEQAREPAPHIKRAVADITSRWPRPLPIVFWETGMNIPDLPAAQAEQLQARQVAGTERAVREQKLAGWMWWTWRDYPMSKAALGYGLNRLDGTPKPALAALRRAIATPR